MIQIEPILKYGTNSTMFTSCCRVAICSDQRRCPGCGEDVIGADEESNHKRGLVRWFNAKRLWPNRINPP